MGNYYLAIDIGASSGRHILGHLENGKLVIEEVYRFANGMKEVNGEKIWDVDLLFTEIKNGMKECARLGKVPSSMGIDTWGVDFVLLDENDKRIGNAVAYRDSRTEGMDFEVCKFISGSKLYEKTGIQKQLFNTIYQLMAVKKNHPEYMEKASSLLMIPDYFSFLLTGVKKQEYTNATTGQLVDPETKDWYYEIIDLLGYKKEIFMDMVTPGTLLGNLREDVANEVGFNTKVISVASHDTASAVMAVPTNEKDTIYISSGTWSLMGTELEAAETSKEAKELNFTNEGGYNYRFRFLKNIMGLWMIQSVRNEIASELSFGEICEGASKCDIESLVPANDAMFLAPKSMTEAVKGYCEKTGQRVPEGIYEIAKVIYRSLAVCYSETIKEIEGITGKKYESIHVVGGGANATYLNELTAKETGRTVYAGPTEATAIGNLIAQFIEAKEINTLEEARSIVFDSFKVETIGGTK